MFGRMIPANRDLQYRTIYSRLCQHQRLHYGKRALFFHNYEAVLLFACSIDANPDLSKGIPEQACCRLRRPRNLAEGPDADVGRFCASVAMLLASIKFRDDIRDRSKPWRAKLNGRLMRRAFGKMRAYFSGLDPRFFTIIESVLQEQEDLEEIVEPMTLDRYLGPSSAAFSYVFGLMSKLIEFEGHADTLSKIGSHVGAAIIALDCAIDWEEDRRSGSFNPLPDREAAIDAARHARCRLDMAIEACRGGFGEHSLAAKIVEGVRDSIQVTPDVPADQGRGCATEWSPIPRDPRGVVLYSGEGGICVLLCLAAGCVGCVQQCRKDSSHNRSTIVVKKGGCCD